ncbi:MBL fold metallo-hydrolase [Halalkalibacter sp. AB-rgal2]|uniref:MBL fold metallo-hydrolase n=1 Tax=Halalkalibacter sp. AB-rgal2 TaxID=3242695 RepID=UPI00359EFD71
MKVTIIGFWGAYPEKNAATSCYLLEQNDFHLLIDCGSGALAQLQNYLPLHSLDGLILSHYHHDHIADIGSLQYSMLINNQLHKSSTLFPIYGHNKNKDAFKSLHFRDVTEGRIIEENKPVQIGPWHVTFCKTEHSAYCLAMKFLDRTTGKQFVYTADTYWCDELVPFATGADLLICEASLYEETHAAKTGHMTPALAAELAREANVQTLVLTHLPHFGDHQDLVKEAKQGFDGEVILAKAGLSFSLGS